MSDLNETHAPELMSWVPGSEGSSDFPIQNLPFGRFIAHGDGTTRLGVAIGTSVLDLKAAAEHGLLDGIPVDVRRACRATTLNALMAQPPDDVSALRRCLSRLLRTGSAQQAEGQACLVSMSGLRMCLAADIRNYSDFFTSIFHATNSGRLIRPETPLLPNFQHLPVAYHGRTSSLCISGTPITRPRGQFLPSDAADPVFEPTRRLDFECELAIHVGRGNGRGEEIPLHDAAGHIFGVSLLNDWSARDVQRWEAQPLGPFLAKSSLTSLSPWIVTMEALAPFRVPAAQRANGAPRLLPYLDDADDQAAGGLNIDMEIRIRTAEQRGRQDSGALVSTPRFRSQYWTVAQMLTHQASNGCLIEPGDILGSGTISGPTQEELGCLMELTQGGAQPITLSDGQQRAWLQDGDEVVLRGRCTAEGAVTIGFGECSGIVLPARTHHTEN